MSKKEKAVIKTANSPLHGKDNSFLTIQKSVHFFQRMPQNNVACFKGNGDRAC